MSEFVFALQSVPDDVVETSSDISGITPYGANFIKSVRGDYRDSPRYDKCWYSSSSTTYTRVERKKAVFSCARGAYKVINNATIKSIRMLDVPLSKYILSANGIALLSSTGYFDLSIPAQMLIALSTVSSSAPGTLDLSKIDDCKIAYSAFISEVMPESIDVEYTLSNDVVVRDRLNDCVYDLHLAHPTEEICIVFVANETFARVSLYLNKECVFESNGPWSIGSNRIVIKFSANLVDGVEDRMFGDVEHQTLNMSRVEQLLTITDGFPDNVYSSYYMTYITPDSEHDDLLARYT